MIAAPVRSMRKPGTRPIAITKYVAAKIRTGASRLSFSHSVRRLWISVLPPPPMEYREASFMTPPNEASVLDACSRFDSENAVAEKALRELFGQYPRNEDEAHVLL